MYAKLENNKLTYAPKNYNTGDHFIINFNQNKELMKQFGFKEIIDNKPSYDNATQYLTVSEYVENENSITINYTVNKIKMNNEPTLEDRIIELEKANKEQSEMIKTLLLSLNAQ